MPSEKRKFGDIGEKIAVSWLEDGGFKILDRNYLKKWGEIDIVAQRDNLIHFIEVKSVSVWDIDGVGKSDDEHRPEDNVHPKKLDRLFRTLETYLAEKNIEGEWQVDVIAVYLDKARKQAKVKFLENIT